MTTAAPDVRTHYPAFRDLSPAAQAAVLWFRQLARALKTCRLYHRDNPIVVKVRGQLFEQLDLALETHGAWRLRIRPAEIFLVDEPVVHPTPQGAQETPGSKGEEQLPFLLYRDGIRVLTLLPDTPLHDFDALFDALAVTGAGQLMHDDLVTLLWQANTTRLQVEAAPVQQTIYLSSRRGSGRGANDGHLGQTYSWSPNGDEIRADIGQIVGMAQGLHRDTFDDWFLPERTVDVAMAYASLERGMQFTRTLLLAEWAAEAGLEWSTQVTPLYQRVLALDDHIVTRGILSHSVATWLVGAIQRASFGEAQEALRLLRTLDPEGTASDEFLRTAMAGLDSGEITERLDQSEVDDQFRFFGLTVAIGRPALELACAVMAKATKSRTRAAACTMLCYLCSENPELLEPYLDDSRWFVVRNAVFVLGQIGGPEVARLLQGAAFHADPRVRRQVVNSLGGVPPADRLPILLAQLDTRDPRLLAATLNMLMRHKDAEVARVILKQIEAPDFESRSEDNQRTLFNALAVVADDDVVPTLEALLHKGGWFARRTLQRSAAARTLQRLGTPRAVAALETGLRSRSEVVRAACIDAMSLKAAS